MMRTSLVLTFALVGTGAVGEALEIPKELAFGIQAAAVLPTGEDLRTTTRSGLNPGFGVHVTWRIDDDQSLRPRLDLWTFGTGRQEAKSPLTQRIDTKVQGLALGAEYVHHFVNRRERWSAGVGAYLIRWSVQSTNHLAFADGATVQASGTSTWLRPGFGVLGCCRLTSHLQVEARWISSRYGYEDLPANLGTVGLLWHF